jgi:acyl-coenzyme A thioesterase PaaI-like protein
MDVSAIPFNRFLGLRAGGTALTLPADPNYLNHLGTVHASAQFALADAASGQWLLERFGEAAAEYAAVVRHADVKFRRMATGELTARADAPPEEAERFIETVTRRGRAAIEVRVEVLGADGSATLESSFEWVAQRVRA